ncbi:MAG TPA: 4Fe-4S binding protein [Terriglobales bacterium]|nr:4Fe-4S binding protein [Terriglobales bacterium]
MSATPTLTPPSKPGPVLVEMVKSADKPKKKLIRRLLADRSQQIRHTVQIAFILLNVVIGIQFYQFVRHYEIGAIGDAVTRPAGVEGYLPIAGLMNLKAALLTGEIPRIHPAGMFLIVAFLAISFIFRKTFCSWLCPVGTLSEYLWKLGRKMFRRNLHVPRWLDIGLRGLKYFLLGFFLWAVYSMAPPDIHAFLQSPYGLIADVKMLNFFRFLGQTGLIVIGVLVLLSVVIQNFWCRYLCPYGALMGFASLLSPLRIRRNPETCIDCAKCAKACPSQLPVDKLITIKSAECTACMECVAVCPAEQALVFSTPAVGSKKPRAVPAWAVAAGIAVIFLGTVGYAKATNRWNTDIPSQVYRYLIPNADKAAHPMPGR